MGELIQRAGHALALLLLLGLSTYVFSREFDAAGAPGLFAGAPQPAAVFFVDNVSPDELRATGTAAISNPEETKIRVFVMPGHEPGFGGAEYKNIKERDITVEIAEALRNYLAEDGRYQVVMGRDANGWNPTLKAYLDQNTDEIIAWKDEQARVMRDLVAKGQIEMVDEGVPHANAPTDVAVRLYGINKWVGENDFDLAIHIHINDYGSRRANRPGEFTGYAIYVPEGQYSNSAAAQMVAESVSGRLDDILPQSDAKKEAGGVIEDQELIAVGRYNTSDVPSMLVEYGYIYEAQFQDAAVRAEAAKEYARQTYLGLSDFFGTGNVAPGVQVAPPREWDRDIRPSANYSTDAFALQVALRMRGFYPIVGKNLRDCPLSGVFGSCTKSALTAFQKAEGVEGEEGFVGEKTREVLNK